MRIENLLVQLSPSVGIFFCLDKIFPLYDSMDFGT